MPNRVPRLRDSNPNHQVNSRFWAHVHIMNDWPNWFTEPIVSLPASTRVYRLALVRRRLAEMRELLTEVRRVVDEAEEGELMNQLTELQSALVQVEEAVKRPPSEANEQSTYHSGS